MKVDTSPEKLLMENVLFIFREYEKKMMNNRTKRGLIQSKLNPKKCFCYVRTASIGQNSKQNKSKVNQEKECQKYALENGLKVTKVFTDEGVSGLINNKPALNLMVLECKKQNINHIVISCTDRLARGYLLYLRTMNYLKNKGLKIHFVKN